MEKELMFGDLGHYEDEMYFNTHEYGNLYYSGQDHGVHFFGQTLGGLRQHGFLVVARNDEVQDRNITFSRHYQNLLSFPKRGRFDCAVLRE